MAAVIRQPSSIQAFLAPSENNPSECFNAQRKISLVALAAIAAAAALLGAFVGFIPAVIILGVGGLAFIVANSCLFNKKCENPPPQKPEVPLQPPRGLEVNHNAADWKRRWDNENQNRRAQLNIDIFNQTVQAINGGYRANGRHRNLDWNKHREMILGATVIDKIRPFDAQSGAGPNGARNRWPQTIEVVNRSTQEMIGIMKDHASKPLVLDMANRYEPGGSVKNGASAQEEALCRQSDLYFALDAMKAQYPFPVTGGILVPSVQFFRQGPDQGYAFMETPDTCDVFVSAAFNCNQRHKDHGNVKGYDRPNDHSEYVEQTKEKMRTMFRAAIANGNDALILSAFGCGAFENDPTEMAEMYREVLNEPEFQNRFKRVSFAIIGDQNYNVFRQIFASRI